MAQQYKIDKVNEVKKIFEENNNFIFNNFSGLTVEKITELRKKLYKLNSKFVVIKNNFIRRIIIDKKLSDPDTALNGPTAVAFAKDDVSEILKILFDFKKNTSLKIKGGYAEGYFYNEKGLEDLSKLPGKKQLIAMLMYTMKAPLQNFVFACNDVIGRFVRVLNAVGEKMK